jgi:ubiquinone/menaquinone biosynthesis C-methylase UbiE
VAEEQNHQIRQFHSKHEIFHHAIEENYMAHHEIHTAIQQHLGSVYNKPFSVLDLGCGDAYFISKALQSTLTKNYTGIDQSAEALAAAKKNLLAAHIKARLIQGDHTTFTSLINDEKFRVIIVGFSLYLLPKEEKIRFFKDCRAHLRKRGRILVYDVIRRHHEERDDYLERYYRHAAENWPTLNATALHQLAEHINMSDHPESLESLTDIARQAGFKHAELLYVDGTGFHQLIEFVQ